MIRKIAYLGHPILRIKAAAVQAITPEIRELIADMVETLESSNGIGLAAPQVMEDCRIFITCVPLEDSDETVTPGTLRVFINPKITSVSVETWIYNEGCLSIPKVYGDVERPLTIEVEATDLNGEIFNKTFTGLEARCILHENDHINGVLFIDRLDPKERKKIEKALRNVKNRYKDR